MEDPHNKTADKGRSSAHGSPFRDLPESEYRDAVLKRAHEIHPNRADIIDKLGAKWAKTGSWRMRQQIGELALKMESAAEVIANTEKYDPWQIAECMVELRDEIQTYLVLFNVATGAEPAPYQFSGENR